MVVKKKTVKKKAVKKVPIKKVGKQGKQKKQAKKKAPGIKRNSKGQIKKGSAAINKEGRPKTKYKHAEWYQDMLNAKEIEFTLTLTKTGPDGEPQVKTGSFKYSTDKNFRTALFAKLLQEGLSGNVSAITAAFDRAEPKAALAEKTTPIDNMSSEEIQDELRAIGAAKKHLTVFRKVAN